ncbi:MAG: hypothetical protein KDA46_11650 [Parvularculaceae bacterium]|nr:hypothetical protein [Parvularculaceae bacterium]
MGVISGMAAGRPILSASVIAVGVTALAAVGFDLSSGNFDRAALALVATLACVTLAPLSAAAVAPRKLLPRLLLACVAAGVLLAGRRLLMPYELSFLSPFDPSTVLLLCAGATFVFVVAAPLWRGQARLCAVGHAGFLLGVAGALGFVAFEQSRQGGFAFAPVLLGLSGAVGAMAPVFVASNFSARFAQGADNVGAASFAVDRAATAIFFLIVLSACALAGQAIAAGGGGSASQIYAAVGPLVPAAGAPALLLGAALALKSPSEAVALHENRRTAVLAPFLRGLGAVLPPSSALAASAIILIVAIVAGFDLRAPVAMSEIILVVAATGLGALFLISLRSALLLGLLASSGMMITMRAFELAYARPSEDARLAAMVACAGLLFSLCAYWRDARDPRRKARDVTRRALSAGLSPYLAGAAMGVVAFAAAQASGIWTGGYAAAAYTGVMATICLAAAPAMMTAVGALFGRD